MARETVEALLNPSLRVSRPVAACARCRSAKIKCDGKLPACSACERSGKVKECSSANDEFARGKERSYVAALETTVERLQRKINEAKGTNWNSQRNSSTALNGNLPPFQHKPINNASRKEAYNVDELVSDFGFLTVNATSRDFHGFTSTMSFARLLMATSLKQEVASFSDSPLPSRYSITPLINYYFEKIYVMLPFFSETEFMASLAKVYQDTPAVSTASPIDIWFIRLVLAISAASTSRSKGDVNYDTAIHHMAAAMKYAEYVLHPGSISGIQALLLLVQYALVDPEHFDSWYLIGMAARLMVDLGLHCEPAAETRMSKQALDLRRRVFYCTYALDRLISTSSGYAFSFTDDSAPAVLLPTLATDLEQRSPSQVFLRSVRPSLFLFDIRRVQSSYYQKTRWSARGEWSKAVANEYIMSTLNDVQSWHSTIPSSFSQSHLQAYYLEYLYSQILAVSPSHVIPMTSMADHHKILLFQYAVQYAEQMQIVVQAPEIHPFLTHAEFCRSRFAAKQFQTLMWASFDFMIKHQPDVSTTPLETCNRAITFLNTISQILDYARQRWGAADMKEQFEQESAVLLARLKSKQQELSGSSFPGGAGPVEQSQQYSQSAQFPTQTAFDHMMMSEMQQYQHNHNTDRTYETISHYRAGDVGPAMHRSNLSRPASWAEQGHPVQSSALNLPYGSLPRRSYEFLGRPS